MDFVDFTKFLWPYIERSGAVAAIFLSVWLWRTFKELDESRKGNEVLRDRIDVLHSTRLEDMRTVSHSAITVIEKNTQATLTQTELIKSLLAADRAERRGE